MPADLIGGVHAQLLAIANGHFDTLTAPLLTRLTVPE